MITIICGTNRKKSNSRIVSDYYQRLLTQKGIESQLIDLALDLPDDFITTALYENSGKNEKFNVIREQINQSEKFVFVVPEYNGSFPGILKVFIDGLEFPASLKGKKGAIVGVSAGIQGGALGMSHLTDIFNYMGMHVLALKPKLLQIETKLKDGQLVDERAKRHLNQQAEELIVF